MGSVVFAIFFAALFWSVIVDSQPGQQLYLGGIDWKADGLPNWMFWISFVWLVIGGIGEINEYRKNEKLKDEIRDLKAGRFKI
jgi:hypothetical protein